jgi:phosphatidylserine/phosphatidylglycerophosphate/cardiolipin synthase-like enzyme
MNKNLISRLINSPKKLLFPLLVMGPISLSIPALAFDDYIDNDVIYTANIQFNPSETENVKLVNDYATFLSYTDDGYARLHESSNELKQKLVDKYSVYSEDEKNVILNELRSSGGVHFHASMQDRQGEYNFYEYSINVDPDLVSTSASDSTGNALDNYLRTSADQFYNTFRNYVEKKEGEGKTLIDYVELTATTPTINKRSAIYSDTANALGLFDSNGRPLNPASLAGKKKQKEVLNQIRNEAIEYGGDLTQSPTFVKAAYKQAEQWEGFSDMTEAEKQESAAEARRYISDWVKQLRIDEITHAQNLLKDNPITPDVLFLQELADLMGVSPKSLLALASNKNLNGKSAFEHLSSEGALYGFLNTLVPNQQSVSTNSAHGDPTRISVNSNRKGQSKQQIIDLFYKGLEVVDETKKANFLTLMDHVFGVNPNHYGPGVARIPYKDAIHALDYDRLPTFMRDIPSYFSDKRAELAAEARKKFNVLQAKKLAIKNDTEAEFNAMYDDFKQANPDSLPGIAPELYELGLSQEQERTIEAEGYRFYQQLIAASDKDDFTALSTNTQRTLTGIAGIFETFIPIIGPLVAAPLHAVAGNWSSFGVSLASGLTDVISLGATKFASSIGSAATRYALKAGKTALAAAEAGEAATKAASRVLNISAQAIGSSAEGYEFGRSIDALVNAKTPEERRQAIMGLITVSIMSAPTPLIYAGKKLNKIRSQGPFTGTKFTPDGSSYTPQRQPDESTVLVDGSGDVLVYNNEPVILGHVNGQEQPFGRVEGGGYQALDLQTDTVVKDSRRYQLVEGKLSKKPRQKPIRNVIDVSSLNTEKKINLAKQAVIAKSTTSVLSAGNYNRASSDAHAAVLQNITTINGGYLVHSTDSVGVRNNLKKVSSEANDFMSDHFSEEYQTLLTKGSGRITDSSGIVMNVLYEKNPDNLKPTIHLVFSGTFTGGDITNQLKTDFNLIAAGKADKALSKSEKLVSDIKSQVDNNAEIVVTGVSLGGAFASYAGIANNLDVVALAPVRLPQKAIEKLGNKTGDDLNQRVDKLTNLYISKDEVTSKLEKNIGHSYKITKEDFDTTYYSGSLGNSGVHSNSDNIWLSYVYAENDLNIYTGAKNTSTSDLSADVHDKYFSSDSFNVSSVDKVSLKYDFNRRSDEYLLKNYSGSSLNKKIVDYKENASGYTTKAEHYEALSAIEKEIVEVLKSTSSASVIKGPVVKDMYQSVVEYKSAFKPEGGWPLRSDEITISQEQSDTLFSHVESALVNKRSPSNVKDIGVSKAQISNKVLMTGDEIWPATYDLMASAEKSIDLQTYIYHETSEAAKWVHKAIDELHQRQFKKLNNDEEVTPVEINFYIDQHKTESVDVFNFKDSTEKNPISNYGIGYPRLLDPRLVKVNVYAHTPSTRGSLHSKTVIIDDKKAVVTSANLKYTHSKVSTEGESRQDIGIVLEGDVVKDLKEDINTISTLTRKNLIGTNEHEISIDSENESSYVLPKKYYPSPYKSWSDAQDWHRYDPEVDRTRIEQMFNEIKSTSVSDADVLVLSKRPEDYLYKKNISSAQRDGVLAAINNAQVSIKIYHANLNVPEVLDGMINALHRGVTVEVLVPSSLQDGLSSLDAKSNFESYYFLQSKAKKEGVDHNLDLRWQASADARLARDGVSGKTHIKYMNIDGIAIVGSMNLDVQSWKYSGELSVIINSPVFNKNIDKTVFRDEFIRGIPFDTDKPLP